MVCDKEWKRYICTYPYWNGFLVSEYLARMIDGSGRQKQIDYCHWSDWRRMQHCEAQYRHAQFQLIHLPTTFAFWLATHGDARLLTNWGVSTFALPIMRLHPRIGPTLTMNNRGFMLSFLHPFFQQHPKSVSKSICRYSDKTSDALFGALRAQLTTVAGCLLVR